MSKAAIANKEAMASAVKAALQDKETLATLANLIQDQVTKAVIEHLKQTIDSNTEALRAMQEAIHSRDQTIQELRRDVDRKTDELEQYQRRQSLRVFGVAESDREDTDQLIVDLAKNIGVNIKVDDIDRSHRVGPRVANRVRPIIVKFVSYRKRREVFLSKRKLKHSGKTIREDLTSTRLAVLKDAIKEFDVSNVWTQDGVIVVKRGDKKMRVSSMDELRRLVNHEL